MTTLTKYWRGLIEDALIAKRADFAERAYNDFYKPSTRTRMAELPEGWLQENSTIEIYIGQSIHSLNYSGAMSWLRGEGPRGTDVARIEKRRTDKEHGRKVYDRNSLFANHLAALDTEKNKIQEDWKKARQEIRAQLYSYSNFEKLLEGWPEIAPIVLKMQSEVVRPANLPVPSTASINKLLGLTK